MTYSSRDVIHKEDTISHHLELINTEENDPIFNNLEQGVFDEIIQQTIGLGVERAFEAQGFKLSLL